MQDQELHVKSYSQMLQDGLDEVFSGEPFRLLPTIQTIHTEIYF